MYFNKLLGACWKLISKRPTSEKYAGVLIHSFVAQELDRHNYVTPTSYLELLSSYGDLLGLKKRELQAAAERLTTGS